MPTDILFDEILEFLASAQNEVDEFLRMNRFMSRLKIKARQKLAS